MLNNVVLMGRLTQDPDLRFTTRGTPVASFTIAIDRDYPDAKGNRVTDFVDIVARRQRAELVSKYFRKGSSIIVHGRLQTKDWSDRDGQWRRITEVVADDVYFSARKGEDEIPPASIPTPAEPLDAADDDAQGAAIAVEDEEAF